MSDDPYVYPGTGVLRNKLNIRDAAALDRVERRMAVQNARFGMPKGDFDLEHLKAIHKHLFQDIYDWAGQVRTVEISKGGDHFMPRQLIQTGMTDIHKRIVDGKYLAGLTPDNFAKRAGPIIGDVNHVHPFREGNGRTQLQYLKLLTERAGHEMDLKRLTQEKWIEASRQANDAKYDLMSECIGGALIGRERGKLSLEQRLERHRESVQRAKTEGRKKDNGDRER